MESKMGMEQSPEVLTVARAYLLSGSPNPIKQWMNYFANLKAKSSIVRSHQR